ncbi:retrotransposon protein, putative, ty3-gypsy subclass, partial [Tanacetum coccineum]
EYRDPTLPFLESLNQMPKGAKVLKDLLSNKAKLENAASSATLSEECLAVIQKNFPKRKEILEVSHYHLADRSIMYPIGICENLLVKIDNFIFLVDFVILEIDEDASVPIILGQPLAMAYAVIDVHDGKLSLRVGEERITFNIGKSMKFASSQDDCLYFSDHIDDMV